MFYPRKNEAVLDEQLFKNPSSEYRGAPFWAWNKKLSHEDITHGLQQMKDMGMGGAHLHCRTGLDTPYLGDEFMDYISFANQKGKEMDLITYLYDEDRWPSGAGGGFVTKDKQHRIRFLVFSPREIPEGEVPESKTLTSSGQAVRSADRTLLGKYQIKLKDGFLWEYKRLGPNETEEEGFSSWYAYLEISGNNPWFNNQAYIDTLDKKAIKRFLEVTHERFYEKIGEEFGNSIPSIFTDEPQFCHKNALGRADEQNEIILPFTDDLEESYQREYKASLLDYLPELFWDLPDEKVSVTRYRYHDHVCERFTEAFTDQIGAWCRSHKIALTGHVAEEPSLWSQTAMVGEAMRSYRSFGMVGVDMLCDFREISTVKQAGSAARQLGHEGVLSELYGVTNWDFDFSGHKLQGDWQAALGVTLRVHHLNWMTMAGEAKRDYPAAIGYQSPWYREYSYIENYFSRLNTVLTRGKAQVKVGVIHPIESYWLYWGTEEKTADIRDELEKNFENLIHWLLFGLVDFDFIAESLLPELNSMDDLTRKTFGVGKMEYDVIVVPGMKTIRQSTLSRLEKFQALGGTVIFTGEVPDHVDAVPSLEALRFSKKCKTTPFSKRSLLMALHEFRMIDVRTADGKRTENLISQIRLDGNKKWVFLSHVYPMKNPDIPREEEVTISIMGNWIPQEYHALTGEILECSYWQSETETFIRKKIYDQDSLLISLTPGVNIQTQGLSEEKNEKRELLLPQKTSYTLEEPNVLVLDMAEYRLDGGEWNESEELLRIDNQCRRACSYPLRMEAYAQPWVQDDSEGHLHTLDLRFHICTKAEVTDAQLALENPELAVIWLNGTPVKTEVNGYYVDASIKKIPLPQLKPGCNELVVTYRYGAKVDIEVLYLLGTFGVEVRGRDCCLTKAMPELLFGDITRQGLPFYGGNMQYKLKIDCPKDLKNVKIAVPQFRNPVIKVQADGEDKGYLAFSPYELKLGNLKKGEHEIVLTAFGNRINTFGTLHNCDRTENWFGPNAWRTEGIKWAYEYQLKESGILIQPRLYYES